MVGSSSIGGLSRTSGDEQLLKSQRVGDKKSKEEGNRKNDERQNDSEKQEQEFEAVIMDVDISTAAVAQKPSVDARSQKEQIAKVQADASKNKESDGNPIGHIDVTG